MSRYLFTPGSQRALAAATGWHSPSAEPDRLDLLPVLLGLLAESECRAAQILSRHQVDTNTVVKQWPELSRDDAPQPRAARAFSPALEDALYAARQRLWAYPQPLELATEHVLLGMLDTDHEVAHWLRQQGLSAEHVEQEIHDQHGHDPTPIDVELEAATKPAEAKPAEAAETKHERPASGGPPKTSPAPPTAAATQMGLLRLFDAAANRAREGLRVVEDYVRFVLDDAFLTGELKELRHRLESALAQIPLADRLAARETTWDVGTQLTTGREADRSDVPAVLAANFHRLAEALRSLEEYSKLIAPPLATEIEQLRYRSYTLQRVVDINRRSRQRLKQATLYVLLDGGRSEQDLQQRAEAILAAGAHVLQLRDKQLDDRTLLARARLLRRLTTANSAVLIVNDRPDLAVLADADGVHVGQEELSVKDARTVVGPRRLVGVSTHSLEQARRAVLDGADYIGMGPTFPSSTKTFEAFPGLENIQAVTAEIGLPAFAIGGITVENCPQVLAAGAQRIAVSGAVAAADDPGAVVQQLLKLLGP